LNRRFQQLTIRIVVMYAPIMDLRGMIRIGRAWASTP